MAHVSNKKKEVVSELIQLAKEYPIIGAVNMAGIGASQLQKMREKLRKKVVLKVCKKRLIRIVLDESNKKDLNKLEAHLEGQPALLFTKDNPFELFKILKANKSPAPAKPGQLAPKDIIIPAGATPFLPGPIIGELGAIGIKTGVEGGKVAIKEDTTVVKKGETISAPAAGILTRLKIEPMEMGLDLTAVYENEGIFKKDTLDINEQEYLDNITAAHRWSFNLAMYTGYPTVETTELLVQNAFTDAKALALSQYILADGVIADIIAKTHNQMLSVASSLGDDALGDKLKLVVSESLTPSVSESTEQPKKEEKNDDDKPKESESSEDAASGLGALFG